MKPESYALPVLLATYAALNYIDYRQTKYAMERGHVEYNPIAKYLLDRDIFDEFTTGGSILSLAGASLIGVSESYGTFNEYESVYKGMSILMAIVVAMYGFVITSNLYQLTKV